MGRRKTLAALIVGLAAGACSGQGDLAPSGGPGLTLKTVAQLEPRTPIASAPFTITQAGSYYLTTNLCSVGDGIVIRADAVTLDLMGYSLCGDRGSADVGIRLDGASDAPLRDVAVQGGFVSGFGVGVRAEHALGCRIEKLTVSSNSVSGIHFFGASGRCAANTLSACSVTGNGSYGIYLEGYSGRCNGNTLRDCLVSGNRIYGVFCDGALGQCNGNTITGCTISDNGTRGVFFYGLAGASEGNRVSNCLLAGNGEAGVYAYYATANRLEHNLVTGAAAAGAFGIRTFFSSANLIVGNTCVGYTNNFSLDSADTYGPVVAEKGALATTNGAAALSPWANFSR